MTPPRCRQGSGAKERRAVERDRSTQRDEDEGRGAGSPLRAPPRRARRAGAGLRGGVHAEVRFVGRATAEPLLKPLCRTRGGRSRASGSAALANREREDSSCVDLMHDARMLYSCVPSHLACTSAGTRHRRVRGGCGAGAAAERRLPGGGVRLKVSSMKGRARGRASQFTGFAISRVGHFARVSGAPEA